MKLQNQFSNFIIRISKFIPIPNWLKPLLHELNYIFLNGGINEIYEDGRKSLLSQWKSVLTNSKTSLNNISNIEERQKILFVTGYGIMGHYQAIEPTLIVSLLQRGCKVYSLYCNISLPSCEFNPVGNNNPASINAFKKGLFSKSILNKCNQCKTNIEDAYTKLPIGLLGLNLYLTDIDYIEARKIAKCIKFENFRSFMFRDVAVGEEAFASILRATFKGTINNTKITRHLIERYIMSGILTVIGYEKAFLTISPQRVICVHGVYQTHGLAVKVAKKLNIPVVVLGGGGIRKDTLIVCHGETYHRQLVNERNLNWINTKLTNYEREKTLTYASSKRNHGAGADYLCYHPNPIENYQAIFDYCKIDRSRKIVSLFTNVIWDAQIFYEGNIFNDIFDWLFTTIDLLGKNENIWLIIRIHPAECKGGMPTKQPMLKEIKKHYKTLPVNVKVIPPESNLSSYSITEISHANIIYGTKMGLEIALMKKTLIVCGETFSRNKGYGLDIVSKNQYVNLLKKIHLYVTNNDEKFEIALKYAFYFYFRRMIDLPIETKNPSFGKSKSDVRLRFSSLEDLLPGKNKSLDKICEGIIYLSDFIM